MTLYCGIDLHSNNSVVAVLDEQDRTVYEKRLPNDLETITEALCIYPLFPPSYSLTMRYVENQRPGQH